MTEQTIYTNIDAVLDLYRGGDLPEDVMAFQYYGAGAKVQWVHRDELKRMAILGNAYPQANTQKGKK